LSCLQKHLHNKLNQRRKIEGEKKDAVVN